MTLISAEGHQVSPASSALEVVAPLRPVVVKELSRIGWLAETKDDDKELPQMGGTAAGHGSLLQRDVPLSIILVVYLVRWFYIKYPPAAD